MAVADTHHHDHHDHGEFIAHHFDNAEQQFDSGKLGIWVFLVTEVLFFSGLFVAYILWRYHHPEIFQQAHVFLDKVLGGINTVVLLFSSLTMALAVRCSQMANNRGTAFYTLVTMVCAAIFLGVKAIEYSHKWDQGILVRSMWAYTLDHQEAKLGIAQQLGVSDWLIWLSIVPAILLGVFIVASVIATLMAKPIWSKFYAGLAITVGGYFLGALGGQIYMKNYEAREAAGTAQVSPLVLHADDKAAASAQQHDHAGEHAGEHGHAGGHHDSHHPDPKSLDRDVGVFFSIYYCMTGLHAFHILGGIAFLSWIYFRSLKGHWRSDYFGPVEYVGLYWHLVDLIWIYLFPMLYLID
jgi:cytochrome c oxidase subunit 3